MAVSIPGIKVHHLQFPTQNPGADLCAAFEDLELRNPEFGLDWLSNLAATALQPGEFGRLYIARRDTNDFVAVALTCRNAGGPARALGNWYTSLYSPLIQSTSPTPLLTALFTHLAKNARVSSLTISPLSQDNEVPELLEDALREAGWRGLHRWICFVNWYHPLDGTSFADYLQSRPSQLRNTIRRKTRRFLTDGKGELCVLSTGKDLDWGLKAFTDIYERSWKQEEPYPRFMPGLLQLAARRGWLRLGIAKLEGRPIAAQVWLVHGTTAYIFKLAYDEAYRSISAGTVLSAHLMEHVIERDRVNTVDYLTGDDNYKKDWMSLSRNRIGIAAFNPVVPGGLAGLFNYSVRSLAKRLFR